MAESEICRLCLEHGIAYMDIFLDPEEESLKIKDILGYYSILNINPDDEISNKICSKCWTHVKNFHEFFMRIQKVQESINSIVYVDTKNDVIEVVLSNTCDMKPGDDNVQIEEVIEGCQETEQPVAIEEVETSVIAEEITVLLSEDDQSASALQQKDTKQDCIRKSTKRRIKKRQSQLADQVDTHEKLVNSFFALPFSCELCNANFESCTNLFAHYESQHKIRGYITCCDVKYLKISKVAEHVLRHKNPDLFKCSKCNIETVFCNRKQLEAHMLKHLESRVFQCDKCEKTFLKKYRYNQHRLTHLSPEEKKYVCQDCGKPYASESLLRVHVRAVHLKSYAHVCEICSKVFKSRVFFEKHQLEHMGQSLPKIQCQICKTWMKNEHTMRAHRRLHEDEGTVHACDICGKTGPSRNSILKHKRYVHLSERTFKCTSCPKAFKRAVSLKEHMTLHTGEILYKCTFCTKTFNSGANMFAHKKKMHFDEWKEEKDKNKK